MCVCRYVCRIGACVCVCLEGVMSACDDEDKQRSKTKKKEEKTACVVCKCVCVYLVARRGWEGQSIVFEEKMEDEGAPVCVCVCVLCFWCM